MVSAVRHWRQTFDPNAKFVVRRRMLFRGKTLERGDELPSEGMSPHTLRLWWKAFIIELADWQPPKAERPAEPEVATPDPDPVVEPDPEPADPAAIEEPPADPGG